MVSNRGSDPDVVVFDFVQGEVRRVPLSEAHEGIRANCRDHGHIFTGTVLHQPGPGDVCICGEAKFEDEYPNGL